MSSQIPQYLIPTAANAIISDLRPITIAPLAINHINLFLDELLVNIIIAAESINPYHLRSLGVPAVFTGEKGLGDSTSIRALGRSAIGEAEIELRSYYEVHPSAKYGFGADGKGRGTTAARERAGSYPVDEAVEMMRYRCVTFSTMGPLESTNKSIEDNLLAKWRSAGGESREEALATGGLWLTAVLEHISENILDGLSRVVARDSSISVAGAQDLYTVICESESLWGVFRRMRVKDSLEAAIRTGTRGKRSTPVRGGEKTAAGLSPENAQGNRPISSLGSTSMDSASRKLSSPPSAFDSNRSLAETTTRIGAGIAGGPRASGSGKKGHQRSSSVISNETRSMLGAFEETMGGRNQGTKSPQEEQDDFDALMRSGETMKISLTPSRLKIFEATGRRSTPNSPQQASSPRHRTGSMDATPGPSSLSPPPQTTGGNIVSPTLDISPEAGSRSRLGSAQKLTARAATTIEERGDDEDEMLGKGKQRKESWADVFASEPALRPDERPLRRESPQKRLVPAVILGAAPPGPSLDTRRPSVPRITPPGKARAEMEEDDDLLGVRPIRKRSSAQELADFFNTTPPPPPPPDPPAKKGFRGLLSKVTGGKKKDDTLSSSTSMGKLSSSASQTGLSGMTRSDDRPLPPRRQKSLQNVSAAPTAYREVEDPPALPTKLRKTSPNRDVAGVGLGFTGGTAAPGLQQFDRTPVQAQVTQQTRRASAPDTDRGVNVRDRPPPGSFDEQSPTTVYVDRSANAGLVESLADPQKLSSNQSKESGTVPVSKPVFSPAAPLHMDATRLSIPELLPPTRPQPPSSLPSDSRSFITAQEADDEMIEAEQRHSLATLNSVPSVPPSQPAPSVPSDERSIQTVWDPIPTIPIDRLVPLRHLLDHATSAEECRLLLQAVLQQWGVPSSLPPTSPEPTPESRVTAWLLAGNPGPGPTVSTSTSTIPSSKAEAEEDIQTPTQPSHALPSVAEIPTLTPAEGMEGGSGRGEEELLEMEMDSEPPSEAGDVEFGEGKAAMRSGAVQVVPTVVGKGKGDSGVMGVGV